MGEEESRRYDNEIKSFKRMLNKDQGETIKKYTKIMIKNENGEFTVFDWNLENNDSTFSLIQRRKPVVIQVYLELNRTLRKHNAWKKKRGKEWKESKTNNFCKTSSKGAMLRLFRPTKTCCGSIGMKSN
jgi:hypothetical protein